MLTSNHIKILKYVMNNTNITLKNLSQTFGKTTHMIRKDLAFLNSYLPKKNEILVNQSDIQAQITYNDFTDFVGLLTFETYLPSQIERLNIIITLAYFDRILNLSKLYSYWGISITTKKRDIQVLKEYLKAYHLGIKSLSGKGIEIVGNLLRHRLLVVQLIQECTDVYDFQIHRRSANSPVENQIFDTMLSHLHLHVPSAQAKCKQFLSDYLLQANYYSKKIFILYILLSSFPLEKEIEIESLILEPLNFYLFENNRIENIAFNQVISMIDFNPPVSLPYNHTLYYLVNNLCESIINQLNLNIITKNQLLDELYVFIYRGYFMNEFKYVYDDRLIKNTIQQFPQLYLTITKDLEPISDFFQMKFQEEQISSITLIFSKCITKNRLFTDNRTRIVIVTNVSNERISYFVEQLHTLIDFELITTLDINEINQLHDIGHDVIIAFSNRINTILERSGYAPVKLKYFMDNDDLLLLLEKGCSLASRRLIASEIVELLDGKQKETQISLLKDTYEEIFL